MKQFDGEFYKAPEDYARLSKQMDRVLVFISDGRWYRVGKIAKGIDAPEASVSAQLRNLRKPANGGYNVISEYKDGTSRYKLGLDSSGQPQRIDPRTISEARRALMRESKEELISRVLRLRKKVKRLQSGST